MRWLADLVYLVVGLLYLPVAVFQALVVGKNRSGWGQRFGGVPFTPAGRPRIWIHAVSLGETNATPALVRGLQERIPNAEIVFSSTTDTGIARATQLYGAERVFRFPLDFSLVIARVLRRIRPACIVLVELEVWYNLVRMATHRGVPVVVVNGRLTARSARRLARVGPLARPMFANLAWVGAQDEEIAARFRALGTPADRVTITSSLKWDTALVADRVPGMEELAAALSIPPARPLWVCGSTGPGEEEILLEAYARILADHEARVVQASLTGSAPLLVLVPRKPERFDEVARLIEQAGFRCIRRSLHPDGSPPGDSASPRTVILGDTMGELRKFYALARVVFVGRSLVPMGGSDPMEVAALGRPIVAGPHLENFALAAHALGAAGVLRSCGDAAALADCVGALVADAAQATALGARAREVVLAHQGATQRTLDRLVDLMGSSPRGS